MMMSSGSDRVGRTLGRLPVIGAVGPAVVLGFATVAFKIDPQTALVLLGGCAGSALVAGCFARSPFQTLLVFWFFEVVQYTIVGAFGSTTAVGRLIASSDDGVIVLLAIMALWSWGIGRAGWGLRHRRLFVGAGVFLVAGIASACAHGVPISVAALGAYLGLKLWVILFLALTIPVPANAYRSVELAFLRCGAAMAVLGFVDELVPRQFRSLLAASGAVSRRVGIVAVQGIFPTPSRFGTFMVMSLAVALVRHLARRGSNVKYLAIFSVGAVMSLRLRSIVSIVIVLAIALLVSKSGERRKLAGPVVLGAIGALAAGSVVFGIVRSQVATYTGATAGTTPRALLYTTGWKIGEDNFPMGVGFGRYGSFAARQFYSPIYDQYHLSNVWGLSRKYDRFLGDTSWPAIIGETGFVGAAGYAAGLLGLIHELRRRARAADSPATRSGPLLGLLLLAVLLVDSTGDSTIFLAGPVLTFAMVVGATLSDGSIRPQKGSLVLSADKEPASGARVS